MSDSLAIAGVTATIRNLLFEGVSAAVAGTEVTARAPDRAHLDVQGTRVNVFLYQTSLDAAWRNQDMPGLAPGEEGRPPLPLSLYYLVTAYSDADDEIINHQLLGRAMGILHDHPVLGPQEIKDALPETNLDQQVERIRITSQPMSLEELSKLWTTFQTEYRVSAAYQACVVLIESERPVRAAPPVLARGDAGDTGPVTDASTVLPVPTIDGIELPAGQPSARPGDSIVLTGHHLDGIAEIEIEHRRLASPISIALAAEDVSHESVELSLPADPHAVPAGFCTLRAVPAADDPGLPSNEVALAVAPRVTSIDAERSVAGVVTVTVDCTPAVVEGQDALLLLSDRAIPLVPVTEPKTTLEFESVTIPPGDYLVRLRVDGVDSHLVDRSVTPPVYDPTQKVTVP